MLKKMFILAFTFSSIVWALQVEKFVDSRDNQSYPIIRIGEKSYFAKNLNYKLKGSYCYGDEQHNCDSYGRLYTWEDAQSACPDGWGPVDEDDMIELEKNKQAMDRFSNVTSGFRNSKGNYELLDKRLDIWLSNNVDANNAKYWFFSSSNNKSNISKYSKNGAMSVRCANYFEPNSCEYNCTCDLSQEFLNAEEFQNDNVMVCSYGSRIVLQNPNCSQYESYSVIFYKKGKNIEECPPTPYEETFDSIETSAIFETNRSDLEYVVNDKGFCIINDRGKYEKCIPLAKASSNFTPYGRKLFGI